LDSSDEEDEESEDEDSSQTEHAESPKDNDVKPDERPLLEKKGEDKKTLDTVPDEASM